LLGFNGCPKPDVVVFNSGYHDRKHPIKIFKKIIFQFLHDLKFKYAREKMNVDIIWAGTVVATSKWQVIADIDDVRTFTFLSFFGCYLLMFIHNSKLNFRWPRKLCNI
jgi:hypothetical protein